MKNIILSFTLIFALNWAFAQTGAITNIQVTQGTGVNERLVDIQFDLTGNDAAYDISLEVSFDNGGSYTPIDPSEVTGDVSDVAPGPGIQLTWDGRISYAVFSAEMARIKIIATGAAWQCGDPITDSRDVQTYNTVLIGSQCWMKENLNYATGNSWCWGNNSSNCDTYGRLYDWATIMNGESSSNGVPSGVQGICPTGWHVPSDEEWKILEGTVDSQYGVGDPEWDDTGYRGYDAGNNLKSTNGWNLGGNGTDSYGFTALPGGYRGPRWEFLRPGR